MQSPIPQLQGLHWSDGLVVAMSGAVVDHYSKMRQSDISSRDHTNNSCATNWCFDWFVARLDSFLYHNIFPWGIVLVWNCGTVGIHHSVCYKMFVRSLNIKVHVQCTFLWVPTGRHRVGILINSLLWFCRTYFLNFHGITFFTHKWRVV